jgi:ectoine hydroxylase-related dioxygenase (phytanoyl-CoA dioxygenase family)
MLTREPIISLVESVLGADCHLIAENALRTGPQHRIADFHVDDRLIFPTTQGMDRHDPNRTLPVHILGIQIPLTNLESMEFGPTQYVPGSHMSGRHPNHPIEPSFEGRGPKTLLMQASEIYLHSGQCWHRASPNQSKRTRYLFQLTYAQRWVSQCFHPFVNYQLPEPVIARADERRRRVLGLHPMGDYGSSEYTSTTPPSFGIAGSAGGRTTHPSPATPRGFQFRPGILFRARRCGRRCEWWKVGGR